MNDLQNLINYAYYSWFQNNVPSDTPEKDDQTDYFPLLKLAKFPVVFAKMTSFLSAQELNHLKLTCKDIKNALVISKPLEKNTLSTDYFPLLQLTTFPAIFAKMTGYFSPQELSNLKITCKDVNKDECKSAVERDVLLDIQEKSMEMLRTISLSPIASKEEVWETIPSLVVLVKYNPKFALKMLLKINNDIQVLENQDPLIHKRFFSTLLEAIGQELAKTNDDEAKYIFAEFLENLFLLYRKPPEILLVTRKLIPFFHFNSDKAKNCFDHAKKVLNQGEYALQNFIMMGDLLKEYFPEIAYSFYTDALEKTKSNSQLESGSYLIVLTQIAKGISCFNKEESQALYENILTIYRNIDFNTQRENLFKFANEISTVYPDIALEIYEKILDSIYPKPPNLTKYITSFVKTQLLESAFHETFFKLIPEKFLISLCKSSPEKMQACVEKLPIYSFILLKIADAFSAADQASFAESMHQKVIEKPKFFSRTGTTVGGSADEGEGIEFVKKNCFSRLCR